MPKLFSSKHIAKVLQSKGFLYVSQRGSHVKFSKHSKNTTLTAIVPANKKEIPYGTFKSILRSQSSLKKILVSNKIGVHTHFIIFLKIFCGRGGISARR